MAVGVGVAVVVAVDVDVGVDEPLGDDDAVVVDVDVVDGLGEMELLDDVVGDAEAVTLMVGVALEVTLDDGVELAVGLLDGLVDGVTLADGDGDGLWLGLGVGLGVTLLDADVEGVALADGRIDGLGVGLGLGAELKPYNDRHSSGPSYSWSSSWFSGAYSCNATPPQPCSTANCTSARSVWGVGYHASVRDMLPAFVNTDDVATMLQPSSVKRKAVSGAKECSPRWKVSAVMQVESTSLRQYSTLGKGGLS